MTNCNCKWGGCLLAKIGYVLLIVGGINWGLVGIGVLMNTNLNIVGMIFGPFGMIEAIVYVLVGVAAVMKLIGCKCKKCVSECGSCTCSTGSTDGKMDAGM